jgi:hypothetical protein
MSDIFLLRVIVDGNDWLCQLKFFEEFREYKSLVFSGAPFEASMEQRKSSSNFWVFYEIYLEVERQIHLYSTLKSTSKSSIIPTNKFSAFTGHTSTAL